jgi:hypothetical protein
MRDFYYLIIKEQGRYKASYILGLIASPIIKLKLSKLLFVSIPY